MKRLINSILVTLLYLMRTGFSDASISNAEDQQCTVNPDGSQTCEEKMQKNDTFTTGKKVVEEGGDKVEYCEAWALRGECEINPEYMIPNCPVSCKNIAHASSINQIDINDDCSKYAKLGECDVNPRYMKELCAKSCAEYEREMSLKLSMRKRFTKSQQRLSKPRSDQCQLYMAESSIPNSGLGMYTAVQIYKGESVFYPEIIMSYFDNSLHAERNFLYKKQAESSDAEKSKWKDIVGSKVDRNSLCSRWAFQEDECENNPGYVI